MLVNLLDSYVGVHPKVYLGRLVLGLQLDVQVIVTAGEMFSERLLEDHDQHQFLRIETSERLALVVPKPFFNLLLSFGVQGWRLLISKDKVSWNFAIQLPDYVPRSKEPTLIQRLLET